MTTPETHVVVVGDTRVGKTSFLRVHRNGRLDPLQAPTVSAEMRYVVFNSNFGPVRLICWDTPGEHHARCLKDDHHYMDVDGAIIMFDILDQCSFKNVLGWYEELVRTCGEELPIVVCGNKADDASRRSRLTEIHLAPDVVLPYFETSLQDCYCYQDQLEAPFQRLLRKIMRNEWIVLYPYSPPPFDVSMTAEQLAQLEAENAAAASAVPLPDEDEDL